MNHTTRESWLIEACTLLEPILREGGVSLTEVRVSCGWPARGALSRSHRNVGECWHHTINKDGRSQVFISPCVGKPIEVLGILLHELIHAALPVKTKHGRGFAKVAAKCGLDGKPTATVVSKALAARINAGILPVLGEYPHQAIDASSKPKQSTRMRLYECRCDPAEAKADGRTAKVRVASDNWQATCDVCGDRFIQQGGDHKS